MDEKERAWWIQHTPPYVPEEVAQDEHSDPPQQNVPEEEGRYALVYQRPDRQPVLDNVQPRASGHQVPPRSDGPH